MSIETIMTELKEALLANTAVLTQLAAGQAKALDKIEAPKPRATAKTKAEAAPATETTTAAAAPKAVDHLGIKDLSADGFKAFVGEIITGVTDAEKKTALVKDFILGALCPHFGVEKAFGPEGVKTEDERRQFVFYVKRHMAGLKVDLNADYDFDGPIDAAVESAAAADDDLG